MLTPCRLELVYYKNYFNLTKLFVLRLFKMATNHTEYFMLKQISFMNFCWPRSTNYVKFPGECVMSTNKHVLVPKVLQMG